MSKVNSIKPTTKESYAMPKIQSQTSNRFEVLGNIPKPSTSSSSNPVYQSKEARQLIQILEVDHISASRTFDLQFFFQKDKFFLSQMMFQKPADSMSLFLLILNLFKSRILETLKILISPIQKARF